MTANPKKVFVVHGRNWRLLEDVMAFLSAIGLTPISWREAIKLTGINAAYIGQALDAALDEAQAVVVLLTGDDELLDGEQQAEKSLLFSSTLPQPRANVLFEAAMAFTRLAEQTILIEFDTVRLPKGLEGRWRVRLGNDFDSRLGFIHHLENAGCSLDLPSNQIIRKTGDFRDI